MIYQLPNGKIIEISIEEYLDLTDQDIQYLVSLNAGKYAKSNWHGSAIKKNKRHKEEDEDSIEEDRSIDFVPDTEEPLHGTTIEDDDEDFPEIDDNLLSE